MSKLRSDELVNMEGDGAPSFPQSATTIEPTADNQVATKSYVDLALSAASGNAVSATPPTNPALGSFWTDTSVAPSILKTWNGSMWIEFAGEGTPYTGFLGSPVEVLTPLDGAGVGGARNYFAVSDTVTSIGDPFLIRGIIEQAQLGDNPGEIETMAYGNGRYVVTTNGPGSGHVMVARYSDDGGNTWTQTSFPSMNSVYKMIHNGTNFVAIGGGDHKIVYSPDGVSWSVSTGDIGYYYEGIDFDPTTGRIVAVGNYLNHSSTRSSTYDYADGHSSVIYSDDNGATWTKPSLTYNSGSKQGTRNIRYHNHRSIAFGNGLWVVASSYEAASMYSTDGATWYSSGNDSYGNWSQSDLIYNSEAGYFLFMARSGSSRNYVTTYNGTSWSGNSLFKNSNQASDDMRIDSVAYGDGNIITGFSKNNADDWYFSVLNDTGNWNTSALPWYRDPWNNYYYAAPRRVFYLNNQFILVTNGYDGSSNERIVFFGPDNRPWQETSHYQTTYYPSQAVLSEVTVASENIYNDADGSVIPDITFAEAFSSGGSEVINAFGGESTNSYWFNSNYGYTTSGTTSYANSPTPADRLSVGSRIRKTSESTMYGPSPTDVVFTSQNANTTPVSATDATVAFRKWTLETRASSSDPWTLVVESDDYDIVASQDGSTPWGASPTLQPNTSYRVKVSYHSANAETIESEYITFETGPS